LAILTYNEFFYELVNRDVPDRTGRGNKHRSRQKTIVSLSLIQDKAAFHAAFKTCRRPVRDTKRTGNLTGLPNAQREGLSETAVPPLVTAVLLRIASVCLQ
jgi:hypothetical protein